MTAVLCRRFGLRQIEIAEDIVSDTFLRASEVWGLNGAPENPAAWLYAVAQNKAKDHLKRLAVFEGKIKAELERAESYAEQDIDFSQQIIADSQLAMIFAVCDPANPAEEQICLALQILCGFGIQEIADAFLVKTETIKKRLYRARKRLRENNFNIEPLQQAAIQSRLDAVVRTLYLLFNEGYFSKSGVHAIRKGLCSEAIRLAVSLTENRLTNTPPVNALLALMLFQSSRLDAREDSGGETVLFDHQDRDLWNKELIEEGNYYLVEACSGNGISKYHLEAGITYWHTTADSHKWERILQLYNQLIIIEYSPMAALNRTFAVAKAHGHRQAIQEAENLGLEGNGYYHALLGNLYADIDVDEAVAHYRKASALTKSKPEKKIIGKEIERLERRRSGG